MDGAMRFVQGDAVAGFFIIIANIVGGVSLGLMGGLSFADATQTYTTLTVGDGLVTQIPSLLTSICAGIIVTRVASNDSSTLGADLRAQLFAQPTVLLVIGAVLGVFAVLPGMPAVPFAVVAIVACAAALALLRKQRSAMGRSLGGDEFAGLGGSLASESKRSDLHGADLGVVIFLDQGSLYRLFRSQQARFTSSWSVMRDAFYQDVGILIPDIQVVADSYLPTNGYRVLVSGVETLSGVVPADAMLVEVARAHAPLLGVSVLREEEHPLSGHQVLWVPQSPPTRKIFEAAGIRSYDFFEFIVARIAAFSLSHPEEFLSVTDVHSNLRMVEKRFPGLVAEGFGREFVSISKLAEILHELVRQGVSIRDFRAVIESVASYCSANGMTLDNDATVDVDDVVRHVRQVRRRQIVRRVIGTGSVFRVISLSQDVESVIREAEYENRALPLALEGEVFDALRSGLERAVRPLLEGGIAPVSLLCSQDIQVKVRSVARLVSQRVFVASYEELEAGMPVQLVGRWDLAHR
jgi:type III secretion protein V